MRGWVRRWWRATTPKGIKVWALDLDRTFTAAGEYIEHLGAWAGRCFVTLAATGCGIKEFSLRAHKLLGTLAATGVRVLCLSHWTVTIATDSLGTL